MRPIQLGTPPPRDNQEAWMEWMERSIMEIAGASHDTATRFIDQFTPSNVTATRTFDADSTTLAEVADVVGTMIEDIKGRPY